MCKVEIDPEETMVAREYLGLKADYPNLHPIHMDGRQFVAEKAYARLLRSGRSGRTMNDPSVPAHLMTKEYNDAVKGVLKPEGAYLLTIIDSISQGKLWKAAMATLSQSFKHVVLLTAHSVPGERHEEGDHWDRNRQVVVIYASDKPFSPECLRAAQAKLRRSNRWSHRSALLAVAGGPAGIEARIRPEPVRFVRTILVPAERLKTFTDVEPGVILTDQFCPVDNLMAEEFRTRNKQ